MIVVPIVLLVFTASICVAGNGKVYLSNSQGYVYQPQRCLSGYCSEKPQLPGTNRVPVQPQFIQRQPSSSRITQQGKGRGYYANPQRYVNQPQGCISGYCYNTPTSPPTQSPLLPPTLAPPQYILSATASSTASNRVSERNCYASYFPATAGAFVAGGDLTKPGEFPHMAAIGYRRQGGFDYQCGGTLISPFYVLTAAHCKTVKGQSPAVARIGGARLDDNSPQSQPIEITGIIVPPNYKRKQVYNDIALIKLKIASSHMPACLWTKDDINYSTATAIGYGQTAFGLSTSTDLLKVDLQLYSSQVCKAYYTPRYRVERGLISSQICAGDFSRLKDTCPGDSGGPLLARTSVRGIQIPFILGVTSFGPGCAQGTPGVYTKVASYLSWIEPIVWPTK